MLCFAQSGRISLQTTKGYDIKTYQTETEKSAGGVKPQFLKVGDMIVVRSKLGDEIGGTVLSLDNWTATLDTGDHVDTRRVNVTRVNVSPRLIDGNVIMVHEVRGGIKFDNPVLAMLQSGKWVAFHEGVRFEFGPYDLVAYSFIEASPKPAKEYA